MPTPSLLIVPARFKTGKLYSQIPTSGAGDFTVTRNTEARRFGPDGLIASVASGIPRLDYYTSGGVTGCPALLVEPAATNLALQSENFLTTWLLANITVTTGTTAAFTAPDGTTSADLLTATANGSARIIQSFSFVSGTTYSYSAFAKAGSGFFGLTMENGGVASGAAVIWNLNTGALAVSGVAGAGYTLQSQGIENYGNGWYRCRMTVLLGLGVAGNIRANTSDGTMSNAVIQSASGNTAYVWGAQLETGSVATSYIPTTTGSVTRNADVINLSGAVSGCIGQTEGTMYLDFIYRSPRIATAGHCGISSSNGQNRVIFWNNNSFSAVGVQVRANNSNVFNTSVGTLTEGTRYKLAIAYKTGDSAIFLNGVQVGSTNTSAFTFAADLVYVFLGSYETSANSVTNTGINAFTLYTTRLSDSELAALTA